MANSTKDNPFTPGAGRTPPLLAGREEETELFEELFGLLLEPRDKYGCLKHGTFPPIRIIAPPGGGRRALLAWIEQEALEHGIRVARSSCPDPICDPNDQGGGGSRPILATMVRKKNGWMGGVAHKALRHLLGRASAERGQADQRHGIPATRLVRRLPARKRFLLIVDDLQNYSQDSIDTLLLVSLRPISRGHPFALVLAGPPLMYMRLVMSKAGFIERSKNIYIGPLSDDATREALRKPFEQAGVTVASDALAALAAQTDNYPYFIQLAGAAAWEAMAAAGRKDIDAELVRRSEAKALEGRDALYAPCYERLQEKGLLSYARQAMELMEGRGEEMHVSVLFEDLKKNNPEVDHRHSLEILDGLLEAGLIWKVSDETKLGIPSFFSYFKARQERETS